MLALNASFAARRLRRAVVPATASSSALRHADETGDETRPQFGLARRATTAKKGNAKIGDFASAARPCSCA
jgi:hypothetical protein